MSTGEWTQIKEFMSCLLSTPSVLECLSCCDCDTRCAQMLLGLLGGRRLQKQHHCNQSSMMLQQPSHNTATTSFALLLLSSATTLADYVAVVFFFESQFDQFANTDTLPITNKSLFSQPPLLLTTIPSCPVNVMSMDVIDGPKAKEESALNMGQISNDAALKGAQTKFKMEECAKSMVQRSTTNYAA